MNASRIACPKCSLRMQVSAKGVPGSVVCPRCGGTLMLTQNVEPAPATIEQSAAKSQVASATLTRKRRRTPPQPPAPPPRSIQNATGVHSGRSTHNTNSVTIIAGLVILLMVGGLTALFGSGALQTSHQGWLAVKFEGCSIKMPKGAQTLEHEEAGSGYSSKELHAQRIESGVAIHVGRHASSFAAVQALVDSTDCQRHPPGRLETAGGDPRWGARNCRKGHGNETAGDGQNSSRVGG